MKCSATEIEEIAMVLSGVNRGGKSLIEMFLDKCLKLQEERV